MIAQLEVPDLDATRDEWKSAVLDGGASACALDDNAAAATRWGQGNWIVKRVIAARRTAECFGSWEYAVEWEGSEWENSWVKQIEMASGAALEQRRRATRGRPWQEMRSDRRD